MYAALSSPAGDEFLTSAEVCALLKINPRTLHNMIKRGDIAAVRVGSGRIMRFRRGDVDALVSAWSA